MKNIIAEIDLNSPAFPSTPLANNQFMELIATREKGRAMSLKEAKTKWAKKRNQLLKLVK